MTTPRVLVEIDGPVAHVILNRPDKLNGVDLDMLAELVAAAKSLRRNREIRAVILRGNGDAFCAGLDFASALRSPARIARSFVPSPLRGTNLFQRAHWVWRELPVPVIAVTHGRCYGAGLQLALAADFRYSTPDCEWSVLEAKWGLVPDMAGTVPLSELVAADVAKRLTMTGEIVSGTRARELGLVSEVADDPLTEAREFVQVLATRSPDSVAAAKKLLNETRRGRPRRAFRIERRLQFAMLRSKNAGIARKANFAGDSPDFGPRSFGR
ncbi:crotonase/enoyl-CoA hydratase family protein [Rhodococcus daqingensis]|uniref:Crotonase/enoyl-CoA hydratase family protein n=1 Tax=Rhodococcus daqingensis TaxID=2479363 RepID=A0ABW2S2N9_9NOCA